MSRNVDLELAAHAVKTLLTALGENTERSGLLETPGRVAKALMEMTSGNDVDAEALLKSFPDDGERYDEMIVVSNIPFTSLCEHHMLPFRGHAAVGYIPDGRWVGLSKLARLVDAYAKRLQVQERLTVQVASTLANALRCKGTGVVLRATHQCMECRGVQKHGSVTTTNSLLGVFREPAVRAEFFHSIAAAHSYAAE